MCAQGGTFQEAKTLCVIALCKVWKSYEAYITYIKLQHLCLIISIYLISCINNHSSRLLTPTYLVSTNHNLMISLDQR